MNYASLNDIEGSATGRYGSGYEGFLSLGEAAPEHAFGAHFCEVHVDPELGCVTLTEAPKSNGSNS